MFERLPCLLDCLSWERQSETFKEIKECHFYHDSTTCLNNLHGACTKFCIQKLTHESLILISHKAIHLKFDADENYQIYDTHHMVYLNIQIVQSRFYPCLHTVVFSAIILYMYSCVLEFISFFFLFQNFSVLLVVCFPTIIINCCSYI